MILVIIPVPVGNKLHLKVDDLGKNTMIAIRNLNGLKVYEGPLLQSRTIDTSHLSPGLYFFMFKVAMVFIK